jgi:hypothetical protein
MKMRRIWRSNAVAASPTSISKIEVDLTSSKTARVSTRTRDAPTISLKASGSHSAATESRVTGAGAKAPSATIVRAALLEPIARAASKAWQETAAAAVGSAPRVEAVVVVVPAPAEAGRAAEEEAEAGADS